MANSHKPEEDIFKFACLYANTELHSCAFIDDSIIKVKAAQTLGITSDFYQNEKKLKQFMSDLL